MTNSAELVYDTLLAEWYSGHSGVLYLTNNVFNSRYMLSILTWVSSLSKDDSWNSTY